MNPELRFIESMRTIRRARGWSQADLAARVSEHSVSLDRQVFSFMEIRLSPSSAHARKLRLDEAFAIAAALGVTVQQMVDGDYCKACYGMPAEGFTCNHCGAGGAS